MDKNKNAPLEKISSHCEHADTDHKAPASKDYFKDSLITYCNLLFLLLQIESLNWKICIYATLVWTLHPNSIISINFYILNYLDQGRRRWVGRSVNQVSI